MSAEGAFQEIAVFITGRDSTCDECGDKLGRHAWIRLTAEKNALCLACADLAHLAFLPSGNTALTRRAKKYSALSAVVLQWSRARKRYERQGLLVEPAALERAESECLADGESRARKRERAAELREGEDRQFIERFAKRVRELFPGAPKGREKAIAEHACLKYSGRVGRSASAKDLEPAAVRLAVVAHVRHTETDYDRLIMRGEDRFEARQFVKDKIDEILARWSGGG